MIAPLRMMASKRAKPRAGVRRPLDGAGAERDDEHQPEQRGERREVAGVVHVLLLHAEQRPAEAGDERGDGEGHDPCPVGRDADRLRRDLAPPQRPQASGRRSRRGSGSRRREAIDEHDERQHEEASCRRPGPTVRSAGAGPGCPGAATCRRRPTHGSFTTTASKKQANASVAMATHTRPSRTSGSASSAPTTAAITAPTSAPTMHRHARSGRTAGRP